MFRRSMGLDLMGVQQEVSEAQVSQPQPTVQQQLPPGSPLQYTATIFAQPETDTSFQSSGPSAFQQGTFVIHMTETYFICLLSRFPGVSKGIYICYDRFHYGDYSR